MVVIAREHLPRRREPSDVHPSEMFDGEDPLDFVRILTRFVPIHTSVGISGMRSIQPHRMEAYTLGREHGIGFMSVNWPATLS